MAMRLLRSLRDAATKVPPANATAVVDASRRQ